MFDASLYNRNLIRTSTTSQLLEEDERLTLSMKALDSGIQTLVYENYSKFIGATDAVKGVGLGVDSVVGTFGNGGESGGGGEIFKSIHGIDSVGDDIMINDPSEEK